MEINIRHFNPDLVIEIAAELFKFDTFSDPHDFLVWRLLAAKRTREMLNSLPERATPGDHEEAFMMEAYRLTGLYFLPEVVVALTMLGKAKHGN